MRLTDSGSSMTSISHRGSIQRNSDLHMILPFFSEFYFLNLVVYQLFMKSRKYAWRKYCSYNVLLWVYEWDEIPQNTVSCINPIHLLISGLFSSMNSMCVSKTCLLLTDNNQMHEVSNWRSTANLAFVNSRVPFLQNNIFPFPDTYSKSLQKREDFYEAYLWVSDLQHPLISPWLVNSLKSLVTRIRVSAHG